MRNFVLKIAIFSLILIISFVQGFANSNMIDFQHLFNSHQSIMLIMRADTGEIVFANDAAIKFYGYSDITSMTIDQINTLTPEEIFYERQLALREERNFFKFKHRLNDGTIKDVEVHAYPFKTNEVSYLYSIIVDRTLVVALEKRQQDLTIIIILGLIVIASGAIFLAVTNRKINKIIIGKNKKISNIITAANVGTWEWNYKTHSLDINERWAEMVGYKLDDLSPMTTQKWEYLLPIEDLEKARNEINKLVENKIEFYDIDFRMKHKDGHFIWVRSYGKIIEWDTDNLPLIITGTHTEISDKKRYEQSLIHSEQALNQSIKRYEELALQSRTITWEMNSEGLITYISSVVNDVLGYTPEELINKHYFKDLLHEDFYLLDGELQKNRISFTGLETKLVSKTGETVWVSSNGVPINDEEGNVIGQRGTATDITNDKNATEQVNYLQYHDQLTGLHNRFYYLKTILELDQKKKYPIVTAIFDIDGLKLINDAFGYEAGNKALIMVAERLKMICNNDKILCRIGGDEFAIIQFDAVKETLEKKSPPIEKISENLSVNGVDLILSYGRAQKLLDDKPIEKIVQEAENEMYKMKALQNHSVRSKAVMSILKTFTNKYSEEEKHSSHVSEYCRLIGTALNYSSNQITEIQYAGLLHDIGKISIPDKIIRKPGKLNDEEWSIMKTHPMVGYEILSTADQYSDIALYTKYHHERVDGKGYPEGLMGSQIPEQSRIIAIVDAYEAMTSDRIYRKALPQDSAIHELRRCANTQFDERLVEVFINDVLLRK